MKINLKKGFLSIFFKNFIGGISWALGVTLGFALLIYILGLILGRLGGLPLVGDWFARLIEVTNNALEARKALP